MRCTLITPIIILINIHEQLLHAYYKIIVSFFFLCVVIIKDLLLKKLQISNLNNL